MTRTAGGAHSANGGRSTRPPPRPRRARGIALLITLIFMSVMLAFGLALASLSYKQSVLASTAVESQYAFYAADAALECALYADQQQEAFLYYTHDASHPPAATVCDNVTASVTSYSYSASRLVLIERMSLDSASRCADVTVYKQSDGHTYLFAQGYNASCATVASPAGARIATRGIDARY